MRRLAIAAAAALLASPAAAQARTEIGMLDCTIQGGVGKILSSSKSATCTFHPSDNGPATAYDGRIKKFGLDVGTSGQTFMRWFVLAPTRDAYTPGALAGTYVGPTAGASIGVGGGANVLVGGSEQTFTLQPVSVQSQTGVNLAVGVGKFTLEPAAK
jgi:hypothetical protein